MSNPLLKTLAAAIRDAYNAPKKDQPELLRAAADLIIELRARTINTDGAPDWRGSSWEYRSTMSDVLADAGVPHSDRIRFGNSVRYHISNALRARLTPEQIAEIGLRPEDAVRRSQLNRDVRRMELAAARKAGFDKRNLGVRRRTVTTTGVSDKEAMRARLQAMLAQLDEA